MISIPLFSDCIYSNLIEELVLVTSYNRMENLFRTVDTDPFVFCAWSGHASLSSNWRNERNEVEWLAESLSSCGSFEPSSFYYPISYCVIALRFRLFYELISERVFKVISQLNLKINKIYFFTLSWNVCEILQIILFLY